MWTAAKLIQKIRITAGSKRKTVKLENIMCLCELQSAAAAFSRKPFLQDCSALLNNFL